jgi:hypothetical protein
MKVVNSFDIYDTILARNVINNLDIFQIIEDKYNILNFKNLRIHSEKINGLSLDTIYNEYIKLDPTIDIEYLQNIEIKTEIEYSYLIIPIYNLIKDGDILISDMYFNTSQLNHILKSIGFKKNVTIYSSSSGKSKQKGDMYIYLKTNYDIKYHYGDNKISDVNNAKKNNINPIYVNISLLNKYEKFLIKNNHKDFGLVIRKFRHQNPYEYNSHFYNLYNEQASYNIPILLMLSVSINKIMEKEKLINLLCLTRDGCLFNIIFSKLYPNINCEMFQSSRKMNKNYNDEYKEYVKKKYIDGKSILFDLHGAFKSGRPLFIDIFGHLPRIHIFTFNKTDSNFDGLTYNINDTNDNIEKLNADIIGTLINMKDGNFIRDKLEYKLEDTTIYKDTVISFCNYINLVNEYIPENNVLNTFFENFKYTTSSVRDVDIIEGMCNNSNNLISNNYLIIIILLLFTTVILYLYRNKQLFSILICFIKKKSKYKYKYSIIIYIILLILLFILFKNN